MYNFFSHGQNYGYIQGVYQEAENLQKEMILYKLHSIFYIIWNSIQAPEESADF